MLPVLTVRDNGSVTITTSDQIHHTPSISLAHAYLWTNNYRIYWSEQLEGLNLSSTLVVLEDVQHWFIATTFRTRSSIRTPLLHIYRWWKECVALRGAMQRVQLRQAQRNRERQILTHLNYR
jgi:hypothetical protein